MRYIWDQFPEYFGPGKASLPVRIAMQMLRGRLQKWDLATSSRVTRFIANSRNVQERIQRIYQRNSEVIYPPVDYNFFSQGSEGVGRERSYYLIVSALAPYKRVDIAIEAFRRLRKPLLIIGDGQEEKRLRAMADGSIEFLGWRDNEALRDAYAGAKALIFPGVEDFGIVPLEAMAAGVPVIAYAKGGALETVVDGHTGLFFNEQRPEALMEAVDRFEMLSWDPTAARAQARKFSRDACKEAFRRALIAQLS